MIETREGTLLRIFGSDADRHAGQPLYKVLVARAHAVGIAGATVLHGPLGFGARAHVHSAKLADAPGALPVVIEFVDAGDAIERFLADVRPLVTDALVTLESVRIVRIAP